MTDTSNDIVDPGAWTELRRVMREQDRKQRNIKWTQADLDETLAFIREQQKQMLFQAINPLIERIQKLEAELQADNVRDSGVTQLRRVQ